MFATGMEKKAIIIFTRLTLLIAFAALFLTIVELFSNFGYETINIGLALFQFIGLYVMITSGTTLKTIYGRIIKLFIAITIAGAMLKIMHWPFADLLLMTGLFGIALIYLLAFIAMKDKGHLNILKLLWVLVAFISMPLIILHYIPVNYFIISRILFWLMMIDFIYLEIKKIKIQLKQNIVFKQFDFFIREKGLSLKVGILFKSKLQK